MMTGDAKRMRVDVVRGSVEEDRLSNLPRSLIDCILERLPLHIAARTASVSKTLRNIWEFHPNLVFDDTFFSHLTCKKIYPPELIHMIILHHTGPILNFHLSIVPYYVQNTPCMNAWIKHISHRGVRNLKLDIKQQQNARYPMPSSLFSCSELTNLYLSNWTLIPPNKFGGFSNLTVLCLSNISITAEISFGTRLRELQFISCSGIQHLRSLFRNISKLQKLAIKASQGMDWQWFECSKVLRFFNLLLLPNLNETKQTNLNKLLRNMPNICCLIICGFSLRFLEPGQANLERLTTTMENLEYLQLYSLAFNDLRQVSSVFCLIRSSPNLQVLAMVHPQQSLEGTEDLAVERHLESPDCRDITLDQLHTVEILDVVGSRAELLFIKLLLASSPSLRRMNLRQKNSYNDPKVELKIARELMLFPRISSVAEIKYFSGSE